MDVDMGAVTAGVMPPDSDATSDEKGSEDRLAGLLEQNAKLESKLNDAMKRIGKLNDRFKEFSETRGDQVQGGQGKSVTDEAIKPGMQQREIEALLSLKETENRLSSKAKEKLQAYKEEGLGVLELARIADALSAVDAGARSASRNQGHAATAAHTPADADVPTTPEEVSELMADPERFRRFRKKYPDFNLQEVMFRAFV